MSRDDFTIEFDFKGKRYKDAAKGIKAFSKDFEDSISRTGPVLRRELQDYLNQVTNALAKRHGNPWPGGTSGNSLSKRSGTMIADIKNSVEVRGKDLADIEGEIGGPARLSIHEFGGVIRAKKAKFLTIPLPAALNSDGTPKKRSAREWDKTFVKQSKKGNLLIFQKRGKDIVPLYVLKPKVTIPPRLNMGNTLRAGADMFVDKAMDAMVKEILK